MGCWLPQEGQVCISVGLLGSQQTINLIKPQSWVPQIYWHLNLIHIPPPAPPQHVPSSSVLSGSSTSVQSMREITPFCRGAGGSAQGPWGLGTPQHSPTQGRVRPQQWEPPQGWQLLHPCPPRQGWGQIRVPRGAHTAQGRDTHTHTQRLGTKICACWDPWVSLVKLIN